MEVHYGTLLVIIAFAIVPASYAINITEIMYNPYPFEDAFNEYIEIYNPAPDPINLTNYSICNVGLKLGYRNHSTNNSLHLNTSFILNSHQYAIITDNSTEVYENYNVSNNSLALHVDAGTLCNWLSDNEEIVIRNSTDIVQNVTYNSSLGANGDGYSLQLISGSWCAGPPTPGYANGYCVQNPITVIHQPATAKFGDFKTLYVELDTAHYPYSSTKLLVYGSPKQFICDLDGEGITARDSDTIITLSSLTPNTTYTLVIPFFIKPNCNSYYENDNYSYYLRLFDPSDEPYLDYLLSITVSGKNHVLCPETPGGGPASSTEVVYDQDKFFLIKAYESTTGQGETITTTVFIKNKDSKTQEYDIYTYVNSGLYLASTETWTSNKQTYVLKPGEYHYLTFTNTIREDAPPGNYTLKARTVFNDFKLTDTKEIDILESNFSSAIEPEVNTTAPEKKAQTSPNLNETKKTLIYQANDYQNLHWILMTITLGILSTLLIWFRD